jgi:hypothetical protein
VGSVFDTEAGVGEVRGSHLTGVAPQKQRKTRSYRCVRDRSVSDQLVSLFKSHHGSDAHHNFYATLEALAVEASKFPFFTNNILSDAW